MPRFGVTFKKILYATEIITAKTEDEAKTLAWTMVDGDEDTDAVTLNWHGVGDCPNYIVGIKELGEEHHD